MYQSNTLYTLKLYNVTHQVYSTKIFFNNKNKRVHKWVKGDELRESEAIARNTHLTLASWQATPLSAQTGWWKTPPGISPGTYHPRTQPEISTDVNGESQAIGTHAQDPAWREGHGSLVWLFRTPSWGKHCLEAWLTVYVWKEAPAPENFSEIPQGDTAPTFCTCLSQTWDSWVCSATFLKSMGENMMLYTPASPCFWAPVLAPS